MTTHSFAIILSIITMSCSAGLVACGGGSEDTANPPEQTSIPPTVQNVSPEMLQNMVPGVDDLPGLTRSDARLLDNEGASARAPDPAARLAHLNEIGRVIGYHALFVPSDTAAAGVPDSVTWSVNLFQQPAGALEFINEPLDTAEGVTIESLDVSSLGADAVGFAVRNTDPAKTAVGYVVAFVVGNVEAGVTATYTGRDPSPDYVLGLARQARTLVESGLGSGSAPNAPQAPLEGEPAAAATSPAEEGGIQVPLRAVVGTPEP